MLRFGRESTTIRASLDGQLNNALLSTDKNNVHIMTATAVLTTHRAKYSLLEMELPGEGLRTIGVLLEDPSTDRLYVKCRRDWMAIAPEETDVLTSLADDLTAKSYEMGAERLFQHLEGTLSNLLQISDRRSIVVEDFDRALQRLYRQHVRSSVVPFTTHLPRYSLRVAAGKFLDNHEVVEEGWEEVPEDLKITPEMFVAHIVGHSMEPKIPDGSLCVFRRNVTGSRHGRLVLIENLGTADENRYTIKRYRSSKVHNPDGTWSHGQIRLEPLNPDFEALDLDPDEGKFRIIAEFVRVLY